MLICRGATPSAARLTLVSCQPARPASVRDDFNRSSAFGSDSDRGLRLVVPRHSPKSTTASRLGSTTPGGDRQKSQFPMLRIAVVGPIVRARTATTVSANPGVRRSARNA